MIHKGRADIQFISSFLLSTLKIATCRYSLRNISLLNIITQLWYGANLSNLEELESMWPQISFGPTKIPRPSRPNLEQVEWFSWTDPLSLFHLFHVDLKTPFSLFHLFHVDLKTRFSFDHLFHVLQLVPTCAIWLYHLFFANSLFSDFFLGFSMSFNFSENSFDWKFSSKYYHVGEGKQQENFHEKTEKTVTIHWITWVLWVQERTHNPLDNQFNHNDRKQ